MDSFQTIITLIEKLATQVPLELFVFLGMFIDELFPPIPSLFLLIVAGAIAKTQGQMIFFLLYLAVIGAIGKTLAAWILYVIGDKAEHLITGKFGKMVGVTHTEIEKISKHLNQGKRDDLLLFIARVVPIIPTTPVSLVCGMIKLNIRTYLISTFAGIFVRSFLFLYFGYAGLVSYEKLFGEWRIAEVVVNIVLLILAVAAYVFYKNKRR